MKLLTDGTNVSRYYRFNVNVLGIDKELSEIRAAEKRN